MRNDAIFNLSAVIAAQQDDSQILELISDFGLELQSVEML